MQGRGSDSGDGPSRADHREERGDLTAGSPRPEPDGHRYRWWDPAPELADLDPARRPVARALVRTVRRPRGSEDEQGDPGPGIDVALVNGSSAGPGEMWEVATHLRRSLDRCADSAPDDELAEARARLDRAIGRLWSAAIEAEVRTVREFVGEVAHDFRSPLHSSLFLTDALFREQTGPLNEAQKQQLSIIHSAIGALLRMSDDLLDFSEPDPDGISGGGEETPFAPAQVLGDLRDLLEPVTHHREAELELEATGVESRVGDPQILNRVLLNLASNALEAVEEGGVVQVRISGDEERLRAVVRDDSDSVDPERIRGLLAGGDYASVVRRLAGQTRGLGLVISGRLVRAAGGEIDVARTEDGWTRLEVTLPFPALETGD